MTGWREVAKRAARSFGLSVTRLANDPHATMAGLASDRFRTILDIGASHGEFAKYALQLFPDARLYCFEPLQSSFRELERFAATRPGNVVAVHAALGEAAGEATIFRHDQHTASSSMLRTTSTTRDVYPQTSLQSEERIRVLTLDGWAAALPEPLAGPLLVKLDVQGFETKVIAGGYQTMRQADACITEVSVASLYEGQARFADLVAALDQAGLHYCGNLAQHCDERGRVMFLDAVFRRTPGAAQRS